MKPPYEITSEIMKLIVSISGKLGEIYSAHLSRPSPKLRRKNRIKTIQSSLEIEGNSLNEDQVTAILDGRKAAGPLQEIREVVNAAEAYNNITALDPFSITSFKRVHKILMKGLVEDSGKFRSASSGVLKGNKVVHIAPSAEMVHPLMKDLFGYLKKDNDVLLIKSCVFHYETELIHPFSDGNGRMGRLWQSVILSSKYPVFEFLPVESVIRENQREYYNALNISDKAGKSTAFIEFILNCIESELKKVLDVQHRILSADDRVEEAMETYGDREFSRKEYMKLFKNISTATASRDLRNGVEKGLLEKKGDKSLTVYRQKN